MTERVTSLSTVEFSFEGGSAADGTACAGCGWMTLRGETLTGEFYFH